MSALELQFFLLPAFLRKALWFFIRRNPYWFKDLAGTAGVTSMGMYTSGAAVGVPITPMTLTLSIGTIEKKLVLHDGQAVERDVVHARRPRLPMSWQAIGRARVTALGLRKKKRLGAG